ncbi:uncharacterized protein B0P05DRAFT_588551 [Gilbertella persicaria]|uniref:uncharacterized protein n=1 Tax=Gilbertella persicaria TaxID=101096 RepID=UPI00221F2E90|nr:uncharacterized protein B0P05DRAFT_588551 [Gilbertella persicaria]KAI8074230.1 hypothetical protein B0P05DRAFT_588551 [Gilbertella persicaria]
MSAQAMLSLANARVTLNIKNSSTQLAGMNLKINSSIVLGTTCPPGADTAIKWAIQDLNVSNLKLTSFATIASISDTVHLNVLARRQCTAIRNEKNFETGREVEHATTPAPEIPTSPVSIQPSPETNRDSNVESADEEVESEFGSDSDIDEEIDETEVQALIDDQQIPLTDLQNYHGMQQERLQSLQQTAATVQLTKAETAELTQLNQTLDQITKIITD